MRDRPGAARRRKSEARGKKWGCLQWIYLFLQTRFLHTHGRQWPGPAAVGLANRGRVTATRKGSTKATARLRMLETRIAAALLDLNGPYGCEAADIECCVMPNIL